MNSMLVKLKVNTEKFREGQIVEMFTVSDVSIVLKSLDTEDTAESISMTSDSFSEYFETDKGLSKVYEEYHSKVVTDLLNSSRETSKYLIAYSIAIMIVSLTLICFASTIGGKFGIVISLLNIALTLTGLCIIHKKSKQSKSTNNNNIRYCRNARRQELIHMLTNLGYINTK